MLGTGVPVAAMASDQMGKEGGVVCGGSSDLEIRSTSGVEEEGRGKREEGSGKREEGRAMQGGFVG